MKLMAPKTHKLRVRCAGTSSEPRSSSRELRIRVPYFFLWSILVGEPSPKKGERRALLQRPQGPTRVPEMFCKVPWFALKPAVCPSEKPSEQYIEVSDPPPFRLLHALHLDALIHQPLHTRARVLERKLFGSAQQPRGFSPINSGSEHTRCFSSSLLFFLRAGFKTPGLPW